MSTLAIWCRVVRSRDFSAPVVTLPLQSQFSCLPAEQSRRQMRPTDGEALARCLETLDGVGMRLRSTGHARYL